MLSENHNENKYQNSVKRFTTYMYHINATLKFQKFVEKISSQDNYFDDEVFSILDNYVLKPNSQFSTMLEPQQILYRAREIPAEFFSEKFGVSVFISENDIYQTTGFDEVNSIECPLGIGGAGRNNVAGMSYLYLAENATTACAEIKTNIRSLISLAQFEVVSPLKIINFSDEKNFDEKQYVIHNMSLGTFFTELMFSFTKPDKNCYTVSQIISDYIRKFGIDGIAYRSFYTGKTNYTIFNSHKSKIKYISSRILLHHSSNEVYWDFNHQTSLFTNENKNLDYDIHTGNEMLSKLETQIKKYNE